MTNVNSFDALRTAANNRKKEEEKRGQPVFVSTLGQTALAMLKPSESLTLLSLAEICVIKGVVSVNGYSLHSNQWTPIYSSKILGNYEIIYEADGMLEPNDNQTIQTLVEQSMDTIISNSNCCLVAIRSFTNGLQDIQRLMPVLSGCFPSLSIFDLVPLI